MKYLAHSPAGSFAYAKKVERRLKLAGLLGLFGFVWFCLAHH